MAKLSAPTDPWLAEFNRYSVPFGAFVPSTSGKREDDQFVAAPPAAWERTFGGTAPQPSQGARSPGGGLRQADLVDMRKRACMRQPIDALRRMPDASEAAHPRSAVPSSERKISRDRTVCDNVTPLSKATPSGGNSC